VQMEIDKGYVECGVLTQNEIREKLNRPPKADSQDAPNPDKTKDSADKKTVGETANSLYRLFKKQKFETAKLISEYCVSGKFMSHLADAEKESKLFFDVAKYNKQFISVFIPAFKNYIQMTGADFLFNNQVAFAFNAKDSAINTALDFLAERLYEINRASLEQLKVQLSDVVTFNLSYEDLLLRVKNIFSLDRANSIAETLAKNLSGVAYDIANNQLFTLRIK